MFQRAWPIVPLLLVLGCQPATDSKQRGSVMAPTGRTNGGTLQNASAAWPFWPVGMRVHPMSRIVLNPGVLGERVLELRLEFVDRDGIVCRAIGKLRIDLHDRSSTSRGNAAICTWELDLSDLTLNHERFDDVMQHYYFRLLVVETDLPQRPEVLVYHLSVNGMALEAIAEISFRE